MLQWSYFGASCISVTDQGSTATATGTLTVAYSVPAGELSSSVPSCCAVAFLSHSYSHCFVLQSVQTAESSQFAFAIVFPRTADVVVSGFQAFAQHKLGAGK